MLDWIGLRRQSAGHTLSLRVQQSRVVAVARCGTSPMSPRTRGAIRVRLRMFRRSTHAAFRARSFCDHWRGDYLARRQQRSTVGQWARMQLHSAKRL
jgi:hypothetical protein